MEKMKTHFLYCIYGAEEILYCSWIPS